MGLRIKAIAVTVLVTVLICSSAAFGAGIVDPSAPVYDPRPDGVSPMRNQYWGTCWAQAGIATMETYLIHQGLEDSSYQLSVEDVLWRSRGGVEATSWNLQTRESRRSTSIPRWHPARSSRRSTTSWPW